MLEVSKTRFVTKSEPSRLSRCNILSDVEGFDVVKACFFSASKNWGEVPLDVLLGPVLLRVWPE